MQRSSSFSSQSSGTSASRGTNLETARAFIILTELEAMLEVDRESSMRAAGEEPAKPVVG